MRNYRVIFFDLDHTLWDYDTNSVEMLTELYFKYNLKDSHRVILEDFLATFTSINHRLWSKYNKGEIGRDEIRINRFNDILINFGIEQPDLAVQMSDEYLHGCPIKSNVLPYTYDALDYLRGKYQLYILTNGFSDVQDVKMANARLTDYFQGVITSECTGHRKPSKAIFDYALSVAEARNTESLMIGDNLQTDILGARNASIDTVYYNPTSKPHKANVNFEINCLSELTKIL